MHEGDRRYLHSEIAANPLQGSITVAGSYDEREAWDASHFHVIQTAGYANQDRLTRSDGR